MQEAFSFLFDSNKSDLILIFGLKWLLISKKYCNFFFILAYFWPNHWYLEERNGFVHVLLVPINDKYWVIVNSRSKDLAKWQKMSENCFLKGKNGQFYSIKWLKYGFSQNRLVFFTRNWVFCITLWSYFHNLYAV